MSTPQQADKADTYRAALELVVEALDIPHAKTVADDEKRAEIVHARLMHVLIMVGSVLDRDRPEWYIDYCREQLAKHPAVGYHPISATIAYGQHDKCAESDCGHRQGSHWEHAEPGGARKGCAYLGCPCTAFAPVLDPARDYRPAAPQVADDDEESLVFADESEYMTAGDDDDTTAGEQAVADIIAADDAQGIQR